MDFKIKRDVFHRINVQLKEEHILFMESFKGFLLDENPNVEGISEHEVYQKAFDFLITDKRILSQMNKKKSGATKTARKVDSKLETIADLKVKG
jgi:hypothetical protein